MNYTILLTLLKCIKIFAEKHKWTNLINPYSQPLILHATVIYMREYIQLYSNVLYSNANFFCSLSLLYYVIKERGVMQFEVNNFAQWQHFYGLAIALSSASFVRERCLSKTNLGSGPWTCYEFSNLLNCRDTEQEKSRQCSIVRSQKYGVWVRLQIDEDVRVLLSSKNEAQVRSMFDKITRK